MEPIDNLALSNIPFVEEIFSSINNNNIKHLAGGLPSESSFPVDLINEHASQLLTERSLYQYSSPSGYQPLIDHLSQQYRLNTKQALMISNGAQQGLDLICRTFLQPGCKVAVETPCFPGLIQVLRLVGAEIIEVNSLSWASSVQSVFATHRPKLFFAVPDFSNPTGLAWSQEQREHVAKLCIEHDVVLVEDAPYREIRYSGQASPLVSDYCPSHSIVLRSFSKTVAPGIRLGALYGPKAMIAAMTTTKQITDVHSSVPLQSVLLGLLKDPRFPAHLETTVNQYRHKHQIAAQTLGRSLSNRFKVNKIEGGMFLWIKVPACDSLHLARFLLQKHIAVMPSVSFYPSMDHVEPAIRINFTRIKENDIAPTLSLLCESLNSYFSEANKKDFINEKLISC
ncbi:PLP-dependent aminotransferase family protein [Vibrio sp. WXL210]|uniref:aminotransferase-like domain-containing protein n=1 Tax=Vibrio sp. WXL210 TaxID=3450709 RepID=UPI003EC5FC79